MFKSWVNQSVIKIIKKFSGVQRRMTKVFSKNNNDFMMIMHHPTEIKSILEAVKNVNGDKKIISFEPHRYSKLTLKKEFAKSFVPF